MERPNLAMDATVSWPFAFRILRICIAAIALAVMCACENPVKQVNKEKPPENKLAPIISGVANSNTPFNTAVAIPFTIYDQDTHVGCTNDVAVRSSNFAVTPATSFILSGAAPNCVLTITPATGIFGTVTIELTVEDGKFSASTSFSFTIVGALTLTGTPVNTGLINTAYAGFTITGAGGLPPYTYSIASGSLPTGVTLDANTGIISGTPTVAGGFTNITLRVTDALSSTADLAAFELDVASYVWDFATAPVVDGTITYTRAGGGTRMGSTGLIESLQFNSARFDYHPLTNVLQGLLIEDSKSNLVNFSERFDTAFWTKTRSSVSKDFAVAPDGTTTADKLIEDATASNTHLLVLASAITKAASAIPYTFSIYAKADERSDISLVIYSTTTADSVSTTCNLSGAGATSNTGSAGGWAGASATITSLASGWYRCTVTGTSDTLTSLNAEVRLNDGASDTYNGNGANGVLLWGAQLEASTQPTSYIPTHNIALQSEAFDTGATWAPSGAMTITADVTNAPDGLSTTADSVAENSGGSLRFISQTIAGVPNDNATYMYSIYILSTGATAEPTGLYMGFTGGTGVQFAIAVDSSNCTFSHANVGSVPTDATVTSVVGGGNTWCRASFYASNNATGNTSLVLRVYPAYANALAGTGLGVTTNSSNASTNVHTYWGAQVEAVQAASPVVRAYSKRGASTTLHTRNADSVLVTSLGTWFSSSEGTMLSQVVMPITPDATVNPTTVSFHDGTMNNRISQLFSSTGAAQNIFVAGVQQTSTTIALAPSGTLKLASTYKANDLQIAMSNTLGTASASASIPTVTQFAFGELGNGTQYLNATITKMTYYPSRVANSILQALTQ